MIKASATSPEGKTIGVIGLSHENVRRLMDGKPIKTSADFLGIEGEIMIFVGPTEQAMADMFRNAGMVGEDTKVHIDPKLEKGQ